MGGSFSNGTSFFIDCEAHEDLEKGKSPQHGFFFYFCENFSNDDF